MRAPDFGVDNRALPFRPRWRGPIVARQTNREASMDVDEPPELNPEHWEELIASMIDMMGVEPFLDAVVYVVEQRAAARLRLLNFAVEAGHQKLSVASS
jgi:hypothetical protein